MDATASIALSVGILWSIIIDEFEDRGAIIAMVMVANYLSAYVNISHSFCYTRHAVEPSKGSKEKVAYRSETNKDWIEKYPYMTSSGAQMQKTFGILFGVSGTFCFWSLVCCMMLRLRSGQVELDALGAPIAGK